MITPIVDVDDSTFGFTHEWINDLANRVEKLYIITFQVGKTKIRSNVRIFCACSHIKVLRLLQLNLFLIKLVPRADIVFSHMFSSFPLLVGPISLFLRKPHVFWRAHGQVKLSLILSEKIVSKIVTSTPSSYRIKSSKVEIIGQGIDVEKFIPRKLDISSKQTPILITIGRIFPSKDLETLIRAIHSLVYEMDYKILFRIIGTPPPSIKLAKKYESEIRSLVSELGLSDFVEFVGPIKHSKLPIEYQTSDVFISASKTGSLDKVILEAMACEIPVVTTSDSFPEIADSEMISKCFCNKGDYQRMAKLISHFLDEDEFLLRKRMRDLVVQQNSVSVLVINLVRVFQGLLK